MNARSIPLEYVDDDAGAHSFRLRRLRRVAWILDRSVPVGNGRRFGLDPILGLIPGIGDWLASLLSFYVLYEAARLGIPYRDLGRMALNIGVETLVGAVPVAGDIFDFVYQANMRNLRIVEKSYTPTLKPRPIGRILVAIVAAFLVLSVVTLTLAFLLARGLWELFTG